MPLTEDQRAKIGIRQKHYLSFLPHVRKAFGKIPGVELIGLGAREVNGKMTDEWAFRFYVKEKQPLDRLSAEHRIPNEIFGVKTDVLTAFEKEALICDPAAVSVDEAEYRDVGMRGGISIRNQHFDNDHPHGYGTLGCLAKNSDDHIVALTCAHVANAGSDTMETTGTLVGQPKRWISCCCCPRGEIGAVSNADFSDHLDCAIVLLDDDSVSHVGDGTPASTMLKIQDLPDFTGPAPIMCFEEVTKRGRTTGVTTGKVADVAYGTHQMLIEPLNGVTTPFACHGDSGAVIVNSSNQIVGLLVAGDKLDIKKGIATHIKPVMAAMDITIAGVAAADLGDPVGGGANGCEHFAWAGGQPDTALNPGEIFNSSTFFDGTPGAVDWDVTTGGVPAVIIEKDGVAITATGTVSGATSIKVRYDTTSPTKSPVNAAFVRATHNGASSTVFRTVFTLTPRAANTSGALDPDNTLRFANPEGGTNDDQSGVATPGTSGATRYLAKTEIVYDITPQDITWSAMGSISFETGSPAGATGNIVARRTVSFNRGAQATGDPNRTHIQSSSAGTGFDDTTVVSTANDLLGATDAKPNEVFRLANEGLDPFTPALDPATLLQAYLRADYHDYLEFRTADVAWVRITPFVEWFANLTGELGAGAPPTVGAPNTSGSGTTAILVPNQIPTVTTAANFEVRTGETNIDLTATTADADNDVLTPLVWTRTSGTAVAITTPSPGVGRFTAPATQGDIVFTATIEDSTGALARTQSNHIGTDTITISVVEWLDRFGGYPNTGDNGTEVFTSADFGFAGPINWDVSTGGANGFIVETGGTAATGLASITVRYDNASADQTRANSVVIRATNPVGGAVVIKRRTVFAAEWFAWPGGQGTTALNPEERYRSSDMGYAAGTAVDWDVSVGTANGLIIATGGTAAAGVATINVRFDTTSASAAIADVAVIKATDAAGIKQYKLRTIFTVTPSVINTAGSTHGLGTVGAAAAAGGRNDLTYRVSQGTTTSLGLVDPSMPGVTDLAAKVEQVWTIAPVNIRWSRRGVTFVFDDGPTTLTYVESVPQITGAGVKFECIATRDKQAAALAQVAAGTARIIPSDAHGVPANDAAFVQDGTTDRGDAQYPTDALPNHIFRRDAPGMNPSALNRLSVRSNFREYIEFRNDVAMVRITPFSDWFVNLTWLTGATVAPNSVGSGHGAVNLDNTTPTINAGADQAVSVGDVVTMSVTFTDAEGDTRSGDFVWTQTGGPTVVALAGASPMSSVTFTAAVVGTYTFTAHADDSTVALNSHNPGNARGVDTINIVVT